MRSSLRKSRELTREQTSELVLLHLKFRFDLLHLAQKFQQGVVFDSEYRFEHLVLAFSEGGDSTNEEEDGCATNGSASAFLGEKNRTHVPQSPLRRRARWFAAVSNLGLVRG